MLSVRDLRFSYGTKEVLKGLSFDIDTNDVISIMGPNGVGKTTFLKCLCNIHVPTAGSICIDGVDVLTIPPSDMARKVAYVPQKAEMTHNTVFDTVLIGRKPHMTWSSTNADIDKAWEVMEMLDLGKLSGKFMDEISGGEFQKVHIARALAQEPQLLVLDEPSNNLDVSNQHSVLKLIRRIVKENDVMAVMTMHDLNLATYHSDRYIFINNGEIATYGGKESITSELIERVYGIRSTIIDNGGVPMVVPDVESNCYGGRAP